MDAGICRRSDVTFSGFWSPTVSSVSTWTVRPAPPARRVSSVYYEFDATVEIEGMDASGPCVTTPWVMQFPMDRRQARRVLRVTGKSFRWVDGQPVFRPRRER